MKIALLMFGHMRTFLKCHQSLKENLLNHYDVDVFIHTWDENESRTASWHNRHMDRKKFSAKERVEIIDLYNPIDVEFGCQEVIEDNETTPNNSISVVGQRYMLQSLMRVNEMKVGHEHDNLFKYDLVIKIRPDIRLVSKLVIPEIASNQVFIAGNRTCKTVSNNPANYRACDIINISDSETMDVVCDAFNEFDTFYIDNINNGTSNHSGFVDYMAAKKLKLDFMDYVYNRDWTIVREASN